MKEQKNFFSSTLKAGIFFIMPIIITLFIFIKVINALSPVSGFIEARIDPNGYIPFLSTIVSVVLILTVFLIGGLIETKFRGSAKLIAWIENNVLVLLPGYQLIKSTAQQNVGFETNNLKVVLVPTDGWSIGFLVEELADSEVLVFIPGSPNPHEGNLNIFQKAEIKNSNLNAKEAYAILKRAGIGTRVYFEKGR